MKDCYFVNTSKCIIAKIRIVGEYDEKYYFIQIYVEDVLNPLKIKATKHNCHNTKDIAIAHLSKYIVDTYKIGIKDDKDLKLIRYPNMLLDIDTVKRMIKTTKEKYPEILI